MSDGQVVPWHQAAKLVGQTITAEGTIVDGHNTGSVCFLNFSRDTQAGFYVIIYKEALNSWPKPPQEYFLNKKIRVTGQVYTYKDRAQIRVRDGKQIEVVP